MRVEQILFPVIRQLEQRPRLSQAILGRTKWGNLLHPDRFRDPYPFLAPMANDGPVTFSRAYQEWAITGYDEAQELLTSPDVGVEMLMEVLLDVKPFSNLDEPCKELYRSWLILRDPPDHGRLRRLVSKAFTPKRIGALAGEIEALADDLVEGLISEAGDGSVDVAAFAFGLPINVISKMLGVPEERWDWMRWVTTEATRIFDPLRQSAADIEVANGALLELSAYFSEVADERKAAVAAGHLAADDDLMTALAVLESDEDALTRDELIGMVSLLMFAGFETIAGQLGNAIVALHAHPEQRRLVRDNPDLWPNAVEELLRYDTSVQSDPRRALRDFDLAGHRIKKGSTITVMFGAVNRDPRRYDRPDELILDRPDPRPLSFGFGIHTCLGAALARLELQIGLRRFVEAFGDYELDPATVEWKPNATLRGPSRLPVRPVSG